MALLNEHIHFRDEGDTADNEAKSMALGRNGWIRCTGIHISSPYHDDILSIRPITTRDISNSCILDIPVYNLDELIATLTKIYLDYKDG